MIKRDTYKKHHSHGQLANASVIMCFDLQVARISDTCKANSPGMRMRSRGSPETSIAATFERFVSGIF